MLSSSVSIELIGLLVPVDGDLLVLVVSEGPLLGGLSWLSVVKHGLEMSLSNEVVVACGNAISVTPTLAEEGVLGSSITGLGAEKLSFERAVVGDWTTAGVAE